MLESQAYRIGSDARSRPPNPDESARLKHWRISTFWVCLVGYIGYYICRANLSAAFPLMSQTFGYTNAQLGYIAAISEAAYALGKFTMGPAADKIGGKKVFVIGLAGAVIFNVLFAFSATLPIFILVWSICRYFLSMGWGGLIKMIGDWYPPERNGTVVGIISINFQFGGVVATVFAGALVTWGVGWQGIFLYPALLGLAILVWSALAAKERPSDVVPEAKVVSLKGEGAKRALLDIDENISDADVSVRDTVFGLLKMPLYRNLLAFSLIAHFLRSFFFVWTPKILVDIGMGTSSAIFSSALFPLFGSIGTILLGWYSDRYVKNGDRARAMWVMLSCLVVCMIALSRLVHVGTDSHLLIAIFLSLAGFFLLAPYSMSAGALSLDIAGPRAAGASSGIIDGVGYVGGAIAAWLTGAFSDQIGWSEVFQFLAGASVVAVIVCYLMSRRFQQMHRDLK